MREVKWREGEKRKKREIGRWMERYRKRQIDRLSKE